MAVNESDWSEVDARRWIPPPIKGRWYRFGVDGGGDWPYDVCRLGDAKGYWLIPAEDKCVNEDRTNLIGPYASLDEAKETAMLLGRFMPPVCI